LLKEYFLMDSLNQSYLDIEEMPMFEADMFREMKLESEELLREQ